MSSDMSSTHAETSGGDSTGGAASPLLAGLAWLWVVVPFGYGLYQLVIKIPALFGT